VGDTYSKGGKGGGEPQISIANIEKEQEERKRKGILFSGGKEDHHTRKDTICLGKERIGG